MARPVRPSLLRKRFFRTAGIALLVIWTFGPLVPGTRVAWAIEGAPSSELESTRLIVQMAPWVDQCLDQLFRRGRTIDGVLGAGKLDSLNRRYGLRAVRPLRRADAALESLAARRSAEQARRWRVARRGPGPTAENLSGVPTFTSTYVLELSSGVDVEQAAREYAADPTVVYAEPDLVVRAQLAPDDPFFASAGS